MIQIESISELVRVINVSLKDEAKYDSIFQEVGGKHYVISPVLLLQTTLQDLMIMIKQEKLYYKF
jgi:hypothetical protein